MFRQRLPAENNSCGCHPVLQGISGCATTDSDVQPWGPPYFTSDFASNHACGGQDIIRLLMSTSRNFAEHSGQLSWWCSQTGSVGDIGWRPTYPNIHIVDWFGRWVFPLLAAIPIVGWCAHSFLCKLNQPILIICEEPQLTEKLQLTASLRSHPKRLGWNFHTKTFPLVGGDQDLRSLSKFLVPSHQRSGRCRVRPRVSVHGFFFLQAIKSRLDRPYRETASMQRWSWNSWYLENKSPRNVNSSNLRPPLPCPAGLGCCMVCSKGGDAPPVWSTW